MKKENIAAKDRIIVALDVNTNEEALRIVTTLGDTVSFYKIGWQLFISGHAYNLIKELALRNKKVFLDLKMEDIGTTIEKAMKNVPDEFVDHVEFLTLKGSGAVDLVRAARLGADARGSTKLKFLMLTALSSLDDNDVKEVYGKQATTDSLIYRNTEIALASGCSGVVASGESVKVLREEFGENFYIITPGIRIEKSSVNEHKRSLTPYDAIYYGSDYLVIGRPIVESTSPLEFAKMVIKDIQKALDDKK